MALNIRRCASVKALMQIKDVTEEDAEQVRHIWRTVSHRRTARERIDAIIRTSGIEYLGMHRKSGAQVYYCNAGDTYTTTIIFIGTTVVVGDWGTLVERNLVKPFEQL